MVYEDFCSEFNVCIEKGDYQSANNLISRELGFSLADNKRDFVDLLNESGVPASLNDSNIELVNRFVDNVDYNNKLRAGASLLVNSKNQEVGFDGKRQINKENVRNCYRVMNKNYSNFVDPNIIAGAIQSATQLGDTAIKGQQKKKTAGIDYIQAKDAQRVEMVKALNERKRVEAEAKSKQTKILTIVGASLVGLVLIGVIAYKIQKGKK